MEEDSFVTAENSSASLEEANWARRHLDNPNHTPSYKTSISARSQGRTDKNTGQSSAKDHFIPTQAAHRKKKHKHKSKYAYNRSRPTSLYGQLYLEPLRPNQTMDIGHDQFGFRQVSSYPTEHSTYSYSSSSFDLEEEEDEHDRASSALTHLENVTESSRSLIDAELLQRHGIGRTAARSPGLRLRRRRKYRKRTQKQKQHSQRIIFQTVEKKSSEQFTTPRNCVNYNSSLRPTSDLSAAPSFASSTNEESDQYEVNRVPSPALTHLEDVTEVSRALIPVELFESEKRKGMKKNNNNDDNKKSKRKKNTKLRVTDKWTNFQTILYRSQRTYEDDDDSIGPPSADLASTTFYQRPTRSNHTNYREQEHLLSSSSEMEDTTTVKNKNSCELHTKSSFDNNASPHGMQKKEGNRVPNETFSLERCKGGKQSQHQIFHNQQLKSMNSSPKQSRELSVTREEKQSFDPSMDNLHAKYFKHYAPRTISPSKRISSQTLPITPPKRISSQPLPISPLANTSPPSHVYTYVLSSKSPHYKGPSKPLPSRAPMVMRIVHELSIGLTDAYRMSGELPQRKDITERGLKDLQLTSMTVKRKEETKEEWAAIQLFLSNLDFLIKLVDITCSSGTPPRIRKCLKQHVQFRSLRSNIRTVNNVISSRFLVERIDRHRLLFRIVLPHKSGLRDERDEVCDSEIDSAVNDIGVMKKLNRSLSEAVRLAIVGKVYLQSPSSPLPEESINTVIGPKSPPAMFRTTKPNKSGGGGQSNDPRRCLPSSPPPFAPYVFRPLTEEIQHPSFSPPSSQKQQPALTYVQNAEEDEERSPSRVCDLPLLQDDKKKNNEYIAPPVYVTRIDDDSTVTTDVHRAITPILGNISPRKKKVTGSAEKGTAIATSHEEPNRHNSISLGASLPPKNGRNEEGLKELVGIIQNLWDEKVTSTEQSGEKRGEEFSNKRLLPNKYKCKEKDSAMPSLVSSESPLLLQDQLSHHYRQDQCNDAVITRGSKSAEEELEALIEVFRERRRKAESDTKDENGKHKSSAKRGLAKNDNICSAEEGMISNLNNNNVGRYSFDSSTEGASGGDRIDDSLKLVAIDEGDGVSDLESNGGMSTPEFSTEKLATGTSFLQHKEPMSKRSSLHKKRLALRSRSSSDLARQHPGKRNEKNTKQPLSNIDDGKCDVDDGKDHRTDTMPTGRLGQQSSGLVDLYDIEEGILNLEILKAEKESAIDKLTETQSIEAPSCRSDLSSSHDIERENKEDILQRNAGVAALELEVQYLSQRLSSLRKKLRQSFQVEAEAA